MAEGDGWALLTVIALVALAGASAGPGPTGGTNSNPFDVFRTNSTNSTSTDTTMNTTQPAASNMPNGPLASCPGFVVGERTDAGMTLRVYYSPEQGGLNCVSGTRTGAVDANSFIRTEIRLSSYGGSSWPRYASATGARGQEGVTGAYVTDADDLCVSANVAYYPSGGQPQSISLRRIACR
jgi:hypothetical protein